jgi:hypothetical protein
MTEAYDKGWVAIDENGKEFPSIPIYGMINGFYVDRVGDFKLDIIYKPQQFFQIGAGISVIAFFGAIFFAMPYGNSIFWKMPYMLRLAKILPVTSQVKGQSSKPIMGKINDNVHSGVVLGWRLSSQTFSSKVATQRISTDNYGGSHPQESNCLTSSLRNFDSSNLPTVIAIVLILLVPFLIALSTTYANLAVEYALGCIFISLVWNSIPYFRSEPKQVQQSSPGKCQS